MKSKFKFKLIANQYWRVIGLILGSVFMWHVVDAATPTAESSSSVSATASSATSSTSASSTTCDQPIPFSAEEFMQKLLIVANTKDLRRIPDKFQKLFAVHLQRASGTSIFRGGTYGLYSPECKWSVLIGFSVTAKTGAIHATLLQFESHIVGPLPFAGGDDACLTPKLLGTDLIVDGWKDEGNVGLNWVVYEYTKEGDRLTATPSGTYNSGSNNHMCIREFTLHLSPTHNQ